MKFGFTPKAVVIVIISLTALGFILLMALGLLSSSSVTGQSGFRLVQNPAPAFNLPTLDESELDLANYIGEPIVVNFWASWCLPCREEATLLEMTWRDYKEKGVMFLGVNIQDREKDAKAYLDEFDVTYPNGMDTDGKVTIDYGVVGIPVTFFINRDGVVERRWVGAVKEGQLVNWVDELIAGVAPSGEVEGENLDGFFELQ